MIQLLRHVNEQHLPPRLINKWLFHCHPVPFPVLFPFFIFSWIIKACIFGLLFMYPEVKMSLSGFVFVYWYIPANLLFIPLNISVYQILEQKKIQQAFSLVVSFFILSDCKLKNIFSASSTADSHYRHSPAAAKHGLLDPLHPCPKIPAPPLPGPHILNPNDS